jgi:hypothetical protein
MKNEIMHTYYFWRNRGIVFTDQSAKWKSERKAGEKKNISLVVKKTYTLTAKQNNKSHCNSEPWIS